MDDQDLLGLAGDGSGTPDYASTMGGLAGASGGSVPAPAAPSAPGFSDNDALGMVMPALNIPPTQVNQDTLTRAAAPAADTSKQSESRGFKVGASTRGFDEGTFNQIKRTQGALAADEYRIKQEAEDRGYGDEVDTVIAQQEADQAKAEETTATINKITQTGIQNAKLAKLHNDFATEESRITAMEQGEAAKRKADYVQALNEFRAAKVNPSQMWDDMGRGGQFAAGIMAFAEGFLRVGGIKTDGVEMLMKGLDRNIDAQVQNIKIKGESVGMFKQLWDMQRAQSASDAEARTRVRGFALESAKLAAESELSKYDSALALAQGRAAIAAIDKEAAKNQFEVHKHVDEQARAYTEMAIQKWSTAAHLAMEDKKLEYEKKWHKDAADAKNAANVVKVVDPATNKPFRVFKPEFSGDKWAKEQADTLKATGALKTIAPDLEEIRGLARQMHDEGTVEGIARNTKLADEVSRRFDALASKLATMEARQLAGRVSFPEVELMLKNYPKEAIYTRGGVEKILAQTEKDIIDKVYGDLQQFTDPIAGYERPYEANYNDAVYTLNPQDLPPAVKERKDAEGMLHGAAAGEDARSEFLGTKTGLPADVTADHRQFRKEHPDMVSEANDTGADVEGYHPEKVAKWETGLTKLREEAEAGDEAALKTLINEASPYLNGSGPADPEAVYATMMLSNMGFNVHSGASEEASPGVMGAQTVHETAPPKPKHAR